MSPATVTGILLVSRHSEVFFLLGSITVPRAEIFFLRTLFDVSLSISQTVVLENHLDS